jgi:hypothetical protein
MTIHGSEEHAMSNPSRIARYALLLALSCVATGAAATAQRTFVASNGSDANPCSLAAPCRSFGAAIVQTSSGGEVIVLDSAGYGPVTISQAVSIIAPAGVYAGVSVFGGAGITVNAGAGIVTLRGLTINSLGGDVGIDYQSGARLYIDNAIVTGFSLSVTSAGVQASLTGSGYLSVRNSALRDNSRGLYGRSSSGTLTVDVEGSTFERNDTGIWLHDGTAGVIRNSTVTDSATGIAASPPTAGKSSLIEVRHVLLADNQTGLLSGASAAAPAFASLISSVVTGNAIGVQAVANPVYCTDDTIARNATGLSLVAGGTAQTAGDNAVANNGSSAMFTSTVPKL